MNLLKGNYVLVADKIAMYMYFNGVSHVLLYPDNSKDFGVFVRTEVLIDQIIPLQITKELLTKTYLVKDGIESYPVFESSFHHDGIHYWPGLNGLTICEDGKFYVVISCHRIVLESFAHLQSILTFLYNVDLKLKLD